MDGLCVQSGQTFLLIGDSITDCGRRADRAPLGDGYASLLVEMITARYPERNIRYINKGIGGNRVTDLRERWHDDVIQNTPDWLSVHIGINDLHSYLRDPANGVSPEQFRKDYDWILKKIAERIAARIVLMEPFYISVDRTEQTFRSKVLEIIPEYIATVHDMSRKYGARLVKLHEVFQKHLTFRGSETFCPEPVHPNRYGHMVIATELLHTLRD